MQVLWGHSEGVPPAFANTSSDRTQVWAGKHAQQQQRKLRTGRASEKLGGCRRGRKGKIKKGLKNVIYGSI